MIGRIPIVNIRPQVASGRWPSRAVVGETLTIRANIFREGHDQLGAGVVLRPPDGSKRPLVAMRETNHGLAEWEADIEIDLPGRWSFVIEAWDDPVATWQHGIELKHQAGVPIDLELREGALLYERALKAAEPADQPVLEAAISGMRNEVSDTGMRLAAGVQADAIAYLSANPVRDLVTTSERISIWSDRPKALFSAWYELFPRSVCASNGRGGTLKDATMELRRVAQMGFDIVYLPPIHPIGLSHRKGPNNTLIATPTDPGSPWAIGGPAGGHDTVVPALGTLADFDNFVAQAQKLGMEVALDFALQCSPDHPWVTEHPEWFTTRADGTIAYAENPPKKYQDIYPLNFDNDPEGLSAECLRIVRFWIGHGVRVFRVDNPHTKPVAFWEWLIAEVKRVDPDVLFLAEAFTRPPMMRMLAQVGFTQSYTYFTWRTSKADLQEYCEELAHTDVADYMRPNFWPNTPDILHDYLQYGGPPAFSIRATLAALLTPSWGIYSGYELCEATAVRPGSEEYLDSEKFQYRPRDYADAPLTAHLTLLNRLRREHPALQRLRNLRFHRVSNDNILAFSKALGADRVLVVVNLDPHSAQEGIMSLDMRQLSLPADAHFAVLDEVTGATYTWDGAQQYIRLDPFVQPAHIFTIREI